MRIGTLEHRMRAGNKTRDLPAFVHAKAGATTVLGAATATRADASTCATYIDVNGVRQLALANVLRDGHYIGTKRTILIESTRINRALRASALDNGSWVPQRATVGANSVNGPDDTASAERLIEDNTAGNTHFILPNLDIVVVNGSTYTTTVFAKPGERNWFQLAEGQGVTGFGYHDVTNGVVGTVSVGTGLTVSKIEGPFKNGFYRCHLKFTAIGTAARIRLFMGSADNVAIYNGDVTKGMYFEGAQLELGAFATSHIPTGATIVTRAVDALSYAGVGITGTLYYRYWDLATLAWIEAVAAYAANDPIVPPVDRAYSDIAVVAGTRTVADVRRIIGAL